MQAHHYWTTPGGTLGQLVAEAYERAAELAAPQRIAELERALTTVPPAPSFAAALRRGDVAVVAEIKRRSPSKGVINPTIAASEQAAAYEAGGAAALSVLTEPVYFGGAPEDLVAARQAVGLPLLRKDFLVHRAQLLEARVLGASAVLLIARALPPTVLDELAREAERLSLEALIEVRDPWELERALATDAPAIGVNNRDLETLEIDITTSERLLPEVPATRVAIYESGVRTVDEVRRAATFGADAVLVGSAISASDDPRAAVAALTGVPRRER